MLAEIRRCLQAAIPLIAAQLVHVGHGLVDMVVAGQLGRAEFAAGGLAATLWFFSSLMSIGLLASLSPLLSELIGRRQFSDAGALFRQGLWLALALGVLSCLFLIALATSLPLWGLQVELIPLIRAHVYAACWSLVPGALIIASRNMCEASQRTTPVFLVTAIGLVVNLFGSLGFGLGWFGLPRLGLQGIGLSTTLVAVCMALCLWWMLRGKQFSRYRLFSAFEPPKRQAFARLLTLSVPIFFALLFEAGLFSATMVQMGLIGTLETAAHSLAISATSFCYMFPLGLSFALTARVGQVYGRLPSPSGMASLRLRVQTGLVLTVVFALFTCSCLILFRHPIAAVYTDDNAVRALAAQLLLLAAVFQLSDAAQATLIAMLRGLQDVRIPMLINAASYWLIAFGLGAWLAHKTPLGAYGLWIGLICGLSVAAISLGLRLRYVLARQESS